MLTKGFKINKLSVLVLGMMVGATLLGAGASGVNAANDTKETDESLNLKNVRLVKAVDYTKEKDIEKNGEVVFLQPFQVKNTEKITSLEIYDDLEDVLDLIDAKIFSGTEEDLTDITDQGTLTKDDEKEKVTWKAKTPGDFFGQRIWLQVTAKLKANVDLDKYLNKETGKIEIPNIGHLVVNEEDIPTDKVVVTPPPTVVESMVKKIIDDEGKEVDSISVDFDKDFTYVNHAQVSTNRKLSSVVLYDDLEDVFVAKSAKVLDKDGKDVTAKGTLKIDKEKQIVQWTATKPENFDGEKLTLEIVAQVRNVPELANYLKDGKISVPNKSVLKINGKDTPSEEVKITPPTVENKAEKFIQLEKTK